jgi:hypothetical protein
MKGKNISDQKSMARIDGVMVHAEIQIPQGVSLREDGL